MLSKSDIEIIGILRADGRTKIPQIAKKMKIPLSTLYEKLNNNKGIIKKHTTLVDFRKLGYFEKVFIVIKVSNRDRLPFQLYMMKNFNMNSLYKINNGHDFMIEAVFEDTREFEKFKEEIEAKFGIKEIESYNVLDDLCQESFLTKAFCLTPAHCSAKQAHEKKSDFLQDVRA